MGTGMMTAKAIVGIVAALLIGAPWAAQAQAPDRIVRQAPAKSAPQQRAPQQRAPQQRAPQQRAPTRVIVRPALRNRQDATEFPRADNLGFPGRNAVRQCVSWLATENRPSGTVVTPQMRCWWQRG
jgi:hypothetical protein